MNKNFVDIKRKPLFSMFLIAFLLISTNRVDVAAASPATHFYVDPPEVRDIPSGGNFTITINVTEALETFGWELYIGWDPALLELVTVNEGDFLHRGLYTTTFLHVPLSLAEANVEGEIRITCSLQGDVPWASGEGWLATLKFSVEAEGACVLNLFDTRLWDYQWAGSPAYTYHPNNDGLFYNRGFPPNSSFHDIAITNVTASLTETGELVAVNVTVTNEGNYSETSTTFNVTVYADITVYEYEYDILGQTIKTTVAVGDEITVGTKTVTEALAVGASTTLTFTWNATDVAGGDYTISAEVKGDDDTRNNLFIDGTVTVQVHDIGITSITVSPTDVTVGDNVIIKVTVKNEGHFNETFNVTTYYDSNVIETKTNINLTSGANKTLTFIWNTTDVAKGTYDIKAEASVVPDEIDTDDNMLTFDGSVKVRGEAAQDILPYVAVVVVIIVIVAAIAVYFIWFRKRT